MRQAFRIAGQEVAAGQELVQLNTDDLEQALLSAEASLESTQSIAGSQPQIMAMAGPTIGPVPAMEVK